VTLSTRWPLTPVLTIGDQCKRHSWWW